MVATSEIRAAWIVAVLMSLILFKAIVQMFKYNEFKDFVKRALADDKMFSKINIGIAIFSLCLIGLGIFYIL